MKYRGGGGGAGEQQASCLYIISSKKAVEFPQVLTNTYIASYIKVLHAERGRVYIH